MTFADKMRNMTDKEFAEIICQIVETVFYKAIGIPVALVDDETVLAVEKFLKQEVEEPQHWTEADIALAKGLKENGFVRVARYTDGTILFTGSCRCEKFTSSKIFIGLKQGEGMLLDDIISG